MILAKREGIASEEALSGAMQQPGTIVAIYSLFSKSDGNGHFRRSAHGLSKFHLSRDTSAGSHQHRHGCRESARGMVKNDQCCEPFATGAGKQLMTMETSGLNIWGSSVAPLHRREATGDRPAEVIHRLGWPQS